MLHLKVPETERETRERESQDIKHTAHLLP